MDAFVASGHEASEGSVPEQVSEERTFDFDCTACGLCCHTGWEVEVGFHDEVPEHLTKPSPSGEFTQVMKTRRGMCIAFRGRTKVKCACAIYANRPRECRDFRPGNLECLRLRRQHGLSIEAPQQVKKEASSPR